MVISSGTWWSLRVLVALSPLPSRGPTASWAGGRRQAAALGQLRRRLRLRPPPAGTTTSAASPALACSLDTRWSGSQPMPKAWTRTPCTFPVLDRWVNIGSIVYRRHVFIILCDLGFFTALCFFKTMPVFQFTRAHPEEVAEPPAQPGTERIILPPTHPFYKWTWLDDAFRRTCWCFTDSILSRIDSLLTLAFLCWIEASPPPGSDVQNQQAVAAFFTIKINLRNKTTRG